MELEQALKEVKGLSEREAEELLERARELEESGMDSKEAALLSVREMRGETDKDLESLRKQLKVKG